MANIDCKQTSTATQQQQPLQDRRILLIRNVSKQPRLYKNEFLCTPFLHRNEKQQMWDKIAQESDFDKTEDAKCKWRSLITYLRQHLDNVAQKKIRRYIPNTENPEDKYVQLTDWPYYSEMEFIVPYVKYAASRQHHGGGFRMEITPNEIDTIIEGIEAEVDRKNNGKNHRQKTQKQEKISEQPDSEKPASGKKQGDKDSKLISLDSNDDLLDDDIILKEYFENMLKSTLKLPRFHQNRIKQKLLDCVNEQKNVNEIN